MSALDIRPARPDELDTVEGLWVEASRWLASKGSDQWQYPPRRRRMAEAIRARECHLAYRDGQLVGTVTVQQKGDPEWWADDDPASALYVHDLAVSRAAAGQAIGAGLLDWAGELAAGEGKTWLRLEAWKTNHLLHHYYLAQGFQLLRIVDLPHRHSGALFQRRTEPRTVPAPGDSGTAG
ncbi:GNAT family N-acetyltransferase [Streptomyces niger]|uniref:GNAT family N-acetyltransferase n=1 Tax=Streptomyces niger TaxID=66373 RepID=UPI00069C8F52|nr:GNAT family N-acetyltransferase [Streptomyces niger]